MSWYHISFSIIRFGKQAGEEEDVEMWVEAPSSKIALIFATMRLKGEEGDLMHEVHVSPPRKDKPE